MSYYSPIALRSVEHVSPDAHQAYLMNFAYILPLVDTEHLREGELGTTIHYAYDPHERSMGFFSPFVNIVCEDRPNDSVIRLANADMAYHTVILRFETKPKEVTGETSGRIKQVFPSYTFSLESGKYTKGDSGKSYPISREVGEDLKAVPLLPGYALYTRKTNQTTHVEHGLNGDTYVGVRNKYGAHRFAHAVGIGENIPRPQVAGLEII